MLESHFSGPLCLPGHRLFIIPLKGIILGTQKTAGGSLGTSHLAFREKGIIFWAQRTAGGSLGTSHLAFREKGSVYWANKTAGGSSVATEDISSVATEDISAVAIDGISSATTDDISSVPTEGKPGVRGAQAPPAVFQPTK